VAEIVKSPKYIDKVSVAVPMPVVESSPLTVKIKGFEVEVELHEAVKVLVAGTVVEFNAILEGLKEQVGPPEQLKPTVSVKVLGVEEANDIVKVVEAVPMGRDCVRVGEVRLKTGFPVPVKVMLDDPLATLSVIVRFPDMVPVLVGSKVIWKAQLPFSGSVNGVEGQVVVSWKSEGVAVMLVTVRGVWPLLVMSTVCGALTVFIV
jgi:hypothetical protein